MKTVCFEPLHDRLEIPTGTGLLDSLLTKKFNVLMACGGKGLCATCHVKVRDGMDKLTNRTERERMTLSFITGTDEASRLACQCRILGDGVVVELPKGMYIERAEDLLTLLGSRAPVDILHPLRGTVLVGKGKIITRSTIAALKTLNVEMERLRPPTGLETLRPAPPADLETMRPAAPPPPARPAPPPTPADTFRGTEGDTLEETGLSDRLPMPAGHPSSRYRIGGILGKCLLIEKIGQGTTGIVYRAIHRTLNIPVAVKILHFEDAENERGLHEKFGAEARLLAQLNHPHILRVWDFEDDAHAPYLVLEHVEGLSLAELIQQSGRLLLDRALEIVMQMTQALAAAWKLGVVHRDVKPGNILVNRDGTAKLADLGLAVLVDARRTAAGESLAGTAAYMAPEQASGAEVDHRADQYALGATFYHALTGRLPFTGRTRVEVMLKHARDPVVPPHQLVADLDPAASAVIARMLAKQPADRFPDYDALLRALLDLQARAGRPPAPPAGLGSTSEPTATSKKSWLSVLGWRRAEN